MIDEDGMEVDPTEVTLSTICDGEAEDQFQSDLATVYDIFQSPGEFRSSGNYVKAKVMIEVELMKHTETGVVIAAVSTQIKRPKKKAAAIQLHEKSGVFTQDPAIQEALPLGAAVTPITAAEEGDTT